MTVAGRTAVCLLLAGLTGGPVLRLAHGYFLEMISDSQFYVLNPGQSVVLECNFHADHYSLFEHPVLWRKEQLDEDVQVNILSNINAPFFATNRFEVTFVSAEPRYQLELSITDVVREDSGNYTCEVRGPHSVVLAQVMHYLFVRAPVETLSLSTDANPTPTHGSRSTPTTPPTLRLTEGRPLPLRCLASGGYPPPTVSIYVDRREVPTTAAFAVSSTGTRLSGTRGLRLITHRVDRWTGGGGFVPRAADDGATVKCVAAVQGLEPRIEATKLDVEYSPKISCSSRDASVGETGVALRCVVRANPPLDSLFWILTRNGTRLAPGEVVDDFWATSKDLEHGALEAALHMRRAGPDKFRTYTIVVENTVAVSHRDMELTQIVKSSVKQPLSDDAGSHPSERVGSSHDPSGQRGSKTSKNSAPRVQMPTTNSGATCRMNCISSSSSSSSSLALALLHFAARAYHVIYCGLLGTLPRRHRR